jgi:hypothetical protein
MADVLLLDNQNVTGTVALTDAAGNAVLSSALDAGSLAVTFTDPTQFTVTIAADQSSFDVQSVGTLETGDTGTVTATAGGVPLNGPGGTPFTFTVDVAAGPPVSIGVSFGAPVAN